MNEKSLIILDDDQSNIIADINIKDRHFDEIFNAIILAIEDLDCDEYIIKDIKKDLKFLIKDSNRIRITFENS